jgi:hypothetical protein
MVPDNPVRPGRKSSILTLWRMYSSFVKLPNWISFKIKKLDFLLLLVNWVISLKTETVCFSKTLASTYKSIHYYNPQDQYWHLHYYDSLRFHDPEGKTFLFHYLFLSIQPFKGHCLFISQSDICRFWQLLLNVPTERITVSFSLWWTVSQEYYRLMLKTSCKLNVINFFMKSTEKKNTFLTRFTFWDAVLETVDYGYVKYEKILIILLKKPSKICIFFLDYFISDHCSACRIMTPQFWIL